MSIFIKMKLIFYIKYFILKQCEKKNVFQPQILILIQLLYQSLFKTISFVLFILVWTPLKEIINTLFINIVDPAS